MPGVVSSPFPPSHPVFPEPCVAGRSVRVSLMLARWYAIRCALCVPRAQSGCPSGNPRVSFMFMCFHALAASAPRPPRGVGVARPPRVVPVPGAGRAVPLGPCPLCPASVPRSVWLAWGEGSSVPFPPYLAWGCALPLGRVRASGAFQRRGAGEGGGACAPSSPVVRLGGPVGRGVCLPRSDPLSSLGRQQSGCLWRHSGHGGRGRLTASVRARLPSPGVFRVGYLCAGPGLPVHRGSCGSRRPLAWRRALLHPPPPPGAAVLPGGGGMVPSTLGGVRGRRPCGPRVGGGEWGDRGGGSRRGSPPPSSGGAACGPLPRPPFVAGASPPRVRVRPGSRAAPGAGRGLSPADQPGEGGGGGGAACVPPSPEVWPWGLAGRALALPQSVPLPSLGGQQSGCHWRRSGHGGRV